ncbi:MAG: hypothetical protein ACYDA3_01735 [Gaiellaceae bacterium]
MKRVLIATMVAAVAAAYPAWAGAATVKGVVVSQSAARGTIAVASARGAVQTLHVSKRVSIGSSIRASATKRADGTFTASHLAVTGHVHRARIHGVVAARAAGRFLVSAGKSMIVVHMRAAKRALAGVKDGPPAVGTGVDTTVGITNGGELDEQSTTTTGNQAIVEVEGTVSAVTATSFDVKTEGGMAVTIQIPAGTTVTVAVGDEVGLKADLQGATLTLVSLDDSSQSDNGGNGGNGDSGGGSGGGSG